MPRSFGSAPTQSATDIAAALMTEDAAPDTAAPQEEVPAQESQEQPERGPRRDASGRFVPREQPVPTEQGDEPAAQPEEPATPAEPEIDYKAEAERQRAELERLRKTYENNTQQQRQALEQARREADELRQAQQNERQRLIQQARQEVDAIPEHDPRKATAERQLAAIERQEAERLLAEAEQARQERATQEQQQAAVQADIAARVGSWGVVEAYAATHGKQLGLSDEEQLAALNALKTDELAVLFRRLPPQELVEHVRNVVGPRLHDDLERRAKTRTEANRQETIREGTHAHPRTPTGDVPAPSYVAFTRENKNVKLGRKAAVDAILAGMLEE